MNKNYTKQSNWLLGIGIVVAILIIAGSIWMGVNNEEPVNAVNSQQSTEIGQSIKGVSLIPINALSSIFKQIL